MQTFVTLLDAKTEGKRLARQGAFPTIYKTENYEYYVAERNEMPPPTAWPLLKWVGCATGSQHDLDSEWVPILDRLDSLENARDACELFKMLGYEPVIVEYHGRGGFDIFLREAHIPPGGWIVLDSAYDGSILHIQPARMFDDDEFDVEIGDE
jgi:hypothetical protein